MMMPKGEEWSRDHWSHLRTVRLTPYRKGMGPTFILDTWDANRYSADGKHTTRYRFVMVTGGKRECLFFGEDFACGIGTAIDSNDAIAGLLGFLTLRPGDTDADYFDGYTEAQLAFAEEHAESVSGEVCARFGEG